MKRAAAAALRSLRLSVRPNPSPAGTLSRVGPEEIMLTVRTARCPEISGRAYVAAEVGRSPNTLQDVTCHSIPWECPGSHQNHCRHSEPHGTVRAAGGRAHVRVGARVAEHLGGPRARSCLGTCLFNLLKTSGPPQTAPQALLLSVDRWQVARPLRLQQRP